MFNPDNERTVVMAGGRYLGTTREGGESLVWFNDPIGSTLVVPEEGLTEEIVRQRLAESDAKWQPKAA
jgi:hypothetical protein